MNKSLIRKIFLERRSSLEPEELARLNQRIYNNLFQNIDFSKFNVLHTFLPIRKNNEINIWPIVSRIRKHHKNLMILISQSDFSSMEMKHFLYKEDTILAENKYGIPEPHQGEEYLGFNMDIILVPLVAFDLSGHRVGYGKGFYDRFLSQCPPEAKKIGLSLFEPVPEIDDINENDISLDFCVTPDHFYSFRE